MSRPPLPFVRVNEDTARFAQQIVDDPRAFSPDELASAKMAVSRYTYEQMVDLGALAPLMTAYQRTQQQNRWGR